ncbi:MAG: acetyl-CoA carboxylase biotin carboxyl carrier protein [Chlorobi bacterium]|nr:acetyl-CoA carboxylase biotin carboxyl carrier protein [Chlorobiota bacterium]
MDLKEIQNLIKLVAKSGVSEVKLETGDFKIVIKNTPEIKLAALPQAEVQTVIPAPAVQAPAAAPAQQAAPAPQASQEESAADESNYITINAPIIGTFYRRPAPDKPPYVEVGDTIKPGDVVCIIEAMKLFNEIESEVAGKIVKVLVEDGTPVEYDQPLFLVEPL